MRKLFYLLSISLVLGLVSCEKDEFNPKETVEDLDIEKNKSKQKSSRSIKANYYPSVAVLYALNWTENTHSVTDPSSYNNNKYDYWVNGGTSLFPNCDCSNVPVDDFDHEDYSKCWSSDCANFVSQCLYEAGLPMDYSWKWKGKGLYPTDSWIKVPYLYNYLIGSAYSINTKIVSYSSTLRRYINSIHEGDLVFYYSYSSRKFSHVTLVTGKTSTDVKVSGHTANQRNYSLSTYLNSYKNHPYDYVVILHFN